MKTASRYATGLTRRDFLHASLAASVALPLQRLLAAEARTGFKIGACDWSIGRTADPTAMELAKQ